MPVVHKMQIRVTGNHLVDNAIDDALTQEFEETITNLFEIENLSLADGTSSLSVVPPILTTLAGALIIPDVAITIELKLGVKATETLTLVVAVPSDGETVTIDTKVYTWQTTLTDVDGNVFIGATLDDCVTNLVAAIVLGTGAGTLYATSMTKHPTAFAVDGAGSTVDLNAIVPGTDGNSIATTETMVNGSFGAATMSGGSGDVHDVPAGAPFLKIGADTDFTDVRVSNISGGAAILKGVLWEV